MPMIVGKHERTLAIDGPYIHVRFITPFSSQELGFSDLFVRARVDHADDEQGCQGSL